MLISKKISDLLVFESETIFRALEKINNNKKRIVFVVNEGGALLGSFSDGDFRRWLTSTPNFDLYREVGSIAHTGVKSLKIDASADAMIAAFGRGITLLPLVDDFQRFVAVALADESGLTIGKHLISRESPAYVIAEIGNNHNGDIDLAKRLVDLAVEAHADCVKFQMRDIASLYKGGALKDTSADLGAQYTMDLLSKFQLSTSELIEMFDYCKKHDLTPLCTPWDLQSLKLLEEYGMEAYKVASADFTNHQLLSALAATEKPLICSTGMSTEAEIRQSVAFLKSRGTNFVTLHCNSTYPTPFKDVNLAYIKKLQEITGGLVGYSGHERGFSIPVAAVALGACVIEKHFTVDKTMEGNDHKVSLLPTEFRDMVRMIREVEEAVGNGGERVITQGELINRETLAKSLVARKPLTKGQLIEHSMLDVKSPGQGLQPMYIDQLIGKIVKRDMQTGDYFYKSDLNQASVDARFYQFDRPFGIPVRYHDYAKLTAKSNLDFVEFHLSYQDLELEPSMFFDGPQHIDFAVHSPELFAGDHIMDLATEDSAYRAHSIKELQRVCDATRRLKAFFPKTLNPLIVINAGGFSESGFIPEDQRPAFYLRVAESLSQIDQHGIEIIIQTMPPFPWHFGGQSHHNLFVSPTEIKSFCSENGYRMCFDVSHSMMACSYFNWSLSKFTELISPHTAHMHIVDAIGVDGEGIQIGEGDVDFRKLAEDLKKYCPDVKFIPEVWQGHKNQGEGFWFALNFLEKYFSVSNT